MFDIPILLIMFNRPEHAFKVFQKVREARPKELYIAIDGPRPNREDDENAVEQCRRLEKYIDWPCNVKTLYRNENLGCKLAVSGAINWFFDQVEYGIILEDDCLPDFSFFYFSKELLLKYKDDDRIMHIGGTNLYKGHKWGQASYFFSCVAHIWGWATWRRAWKLYDINMQSYPAFKSDGKINDIVSYGPSKPYWYLAFDDTYSGNLDTWDYQWVFAIWKNKGITIIPNQNLISNIGFGTGATHTILNSEFSNLLTVPISVVDINHPLKVSIDNDALNYAFKHFYTLPSWWQAKMNGIRRRLYKMRNHINHYRFN